MKVIKPFFVIEDIQLNKKIGENARVYIIGSWEISHEIMRCFLSLDYREFIHYPHFYPNIQGMEVIEPSFIKKRSGKKYLVWQVAIQTLERAYNDLIKLGVAPREAETVLPTSLKTEIKMTLSLKEWHQFFRVYCSERANPRMNKISVQLLKEFQKRIPVLFDDIAIG